MKKNNKNRNRHIKIIISIFLVLIASALCLYWSGNLHLTGVFDKIMAMLSLLVSAFSAYFIVLQLKGERTISEADFLVNLNQTFTGDPGYAKVYTELEKELNDPPGNPELSRIEISNYLTFFETIYLLIEEKVMDIEAINDLFSYRFFLAVHSNCVQDMKLVKEPYNFRNLYKLESLWMEYRHNQGLGVFREENCLKKSCEKAGKADIYEDIITHSIK